MDAHKYSDLRISVQIYYPQIEAEEEYSAKIGNAIKLSF